MIRGIRNEEESAYPYIREDLLTPEFIEELTENTPYMIGCLPESVVLEDMVLSMIKSDPFAFETLPEGMKTRKVCAYVLEECSSVVGGHGVPLYYHIPEPIFRELVFSLSGVSDEVKESLYQKFLKRNERE